ncbi:MAG: hypothetical protein C0622_03365, partial [Desulfuromonas sp.]
GFTLPLLQRLAAAKLPKGKRPVRALVLTPTRELAAQVAENVRSYGKYLPLRSAVIFGGVSIRPQFEALRRGVDVLVATPGRLLDHVGQGSLDLSAIEILVLDEADRMLDMGFIHDIRKILVLLPARRQNLLFSATFSNDIRKLAGGFLNSPETIEVAPRNTTAERVEQQVHLVDKKQKRALLSHLISSGDWRQVLVFSRTKHGANRLADQLIKDGITSAAIHGNKSQNARTKALADFKRGAVRVLVATDIAARGLDIDQLPHVVNFELPNVAEDYVHRIGRTGRAGHAGEAVSLVAEDEMKLLKEIEKLLGSKLPQAKVEGFRPDPSRTAAEPEQRKRPHTAAKKSNGNRNQASAKKTAGGNAGRARQRNRRPGQNKAKQQAASNS